MHGLSDSLTRSLTHSRTHPLTHPLTHSRPKELLCILGAIVLFRDTFTPLNTLGFCLCAVGILVYNVHKVGTLRNPNPNPNP